MKAKEPSLGPAGQFAQLWIDSKLTPLFIVASVLVGIFAVVNLPREEEPQISVPMIDVFVSLPGASAREVEERVTKPMEKLLWEISGVEYLYSTSSPGQALVIVRFLVGQNMEQSLVRLNQKLQANFDLIPPGASPPLVKPRSIDDVPILALTLSSSRYSDFELRRIAAQLHDVVKQTPDVSAVELLGGQRRKITVTLDPNRLAAYGVSPLGIAQALGAANQSLPAGAIAKENQQILLEAGDFLRSAEEVRQVVIHAQHGRPVRLADVARVEDGGEEALVYVRYRSKERTNGANHSAVTLAISKRPSTNAIAVAEAVLARVDSTKAKLLPAGVDIAITRHYGETAQEKSNELLEHMAIAVISVSVLIALVLGRRESVIVFLAIPVTLALTLAVFYFYGFTLNRITLFALIFSIGILVDDAIVVVENIVRHWRMPENAERAPFQVAVEAVSEVGNPTILATLAVIAAILPMAFVGGLMGPYMRPIPIGATAAMVFSLIVAFLVTPYAAVRILKRDEAGHEEHAEDWFTRWYRRFMGRLLASPMARWSFLGGTFLLLLAACSLVYFGGVKMKMLPFDNKSEFQIIIDMPNGTSLEKTASVAQALATEVEKQPEVTEVITYVGTASPYNFNGLVRHYYLRRGAQVADLQVNLLSKHDRKLQSHDIAKQVRARIAPLAAKYGARIKVAEVPPGPPVLATLVAEIFGPNLDQRIALADQVKRLFRESPGVVDVDWFVEDPQPKLRFRVDQEKAALSGISRTQIARTLQLATAGYPAGLLHVDSEKEDIAIELRLSRADRASLSQLLSLRVAGPGGQSVALAELVHAEQGVEEKSIYHKNLMPVTYVIADVAGATESPVYAILNLAPKLEALGLVQNYTEVPHNASAYEMKWDGEWHVTYEVFRDLGIAFAAVLILIYGLMVGWFKSFVTPIVIMLAIPFSLVGIMPAHAAMGAFFTATSMIGFMAGAGIVVRNSIILVDFIELRLAEGHSLAQAVIDSGAIRFRPMLLTAAAVVVGASVILFDPIFQGLAISLMAGEIASLLLSRMAVPIFYYLFNQNKKGTLAV
ncbi:MAG: efflux RND transporter permease subunit [Bryobacter sp.]|nr:efflux RND transporter permease subunit [Bryobacter sp.]